MADFEEGWSVLGYARQEVTHYWQKSRGGSKFYVHSLCGRMAPKKYIYCDASALLPHCKNCIKKLEKKNVHTNEA